MLFDLLILMEPTASDGRAELRKEPLAKAVTDDEVLQRVINEGHSNDRAIVESIDPGIAHSTHLIAVLSERTMGS
jgi:hypothetical protein